MDAICWQAPPAAPTAAASQGTGQASAFTAGGSGTGQQQQQSYSGTQGRAHAHMRALHYMSGLLPPLIRLATQSPLKAGTLHTEQDARYSLRLVFPVAPVAVADIRLLAIVLMCSSKPSS